MKLEPTRWAAAGAALLLAAGGISLWATAERGVANTGTAQAAAPAPDPLPSAVEPEPLLTAPPAPAAKSREERRFARVDRDDDGRITQTEYLALRRRNFDRLDANGDGRLSFEEYAVKGIEKFRELDSSRNGLLDAGEFAKGAPKPRSPQQSAAACRCSPAQTAAIED